MKGVVLAAASSGSGKTTVTCAILKALINRKVNVTACKCGPDYIDPMFHKKVLGIESKNLDSFFCDENLIKTLYENHTENSDITIVEGVMGFYDGLSMDSSRASTYDIAKILGLPVVLVINAKGSALTLASVINGICNFKKDSNIKGVILNNISENVYNMLKNVIEKECNIKVCGFLPNISDCIIENRHLGLVLPNEIKAINEKITKLGEYAEKYIDIDSILNISDYKKSNVQENIKVNKKKKAIIAVAFDDAFCFYYKDNIELLKSFGCEIKYFSPINDKNIPKDADGVIFGGGYPEIYCKSLSNNKSMLKDIFFKLNKGLPCLAECGGFMYLHKNMEDIEKNIYPLVGFIDGNAFKCDKLVRFGYVELSANNDNILFNKGEKIKAQEFQYWDSTQNGNDFLAEKPTGKRKWECISIIKNTVCGFPHLFYYSNKKFVENFVNMCIKYRDKNVNN